MRSVLAIFLATCLHLLLWFAVPQWLEPQLLQPERMQVRLQEVPRREVPPVLAEDAVSTPAKRPPSAEHKAAATATKKKAEVVPITALTKDYLATAYTDRAIAIENRVRAGIAAETEGHATTYVDLPELEEAARFFRFYLDIPFGLAQIKIQGRAEARLVKGLDGKWVIHELRGDPYFGVTLHQALTEGLKEKEVQAALNLSRFQTLLVTLRFLRADEALERNLPLFYVDGHIIRLSAFHIDKVECVGDRQRACDEDLRKLEGHPVFRSLSGRETAAARFLAPL